MLAASNYLALRYWFLKCHSPVEKSWIPLKKKVKTGARKYRMNLEYLVVQKNKYSKNDVNLLKGHRNQNERGSTDQVWENLNIK